MIMISEYYFTSFNLNIVIKYCITLDTQLTGDCITTNIKKRITIIIAVVSGTITLHPAINAIPITTRGADICNNTLPISTVCVCSRGGATPIST